MQPAPRRARGQPLERAVAVLRVRVEQDRDVLGHVLQREVARGAEAGVVAALDDRGAVAAGELRAAVVGAGVHHDELRPGQRRQQLRELRPRPVEHDDDRERQLEGPRSIASR